MGDFLHKKGRVLLANRRFDEVNDAKRQSRIRNATAVIRNPIVLAKTHRQTDQSHE
jgi:hypothetical protein